MDFFREVGIDQTLVYILLFSLLASACIFFRKQLKSIFSFLSNAVLGVGALILVHLLSGFLSFTVGLNFFNVAVAFFLGLPGVFLTLMLNVIF